MNSSKKSTLLAAFSLTVLVAFLTTGCNTMKGLGKDTEKAGEKIQEKASR